MCLLQPVFFEGKERDFREVVQKLFVAVFFLPAWWSECC